MKFMTLPFLEPHEQKRAKFSKISRAILVPILKGQPLFVMSNKSSCHFKPILFNKFYEILYCSRDISKKECYNEHYCLYNVLQNISPQTLIIIIIDWWN